MAAPSRGTHTSKRCFYYIFVFFMVTYGYFFQGGGWNQNGRIYLTQAIINQGTFAIDAYKEDSAQMAFVNMGDWAFHNGHYYSNKSPGLSFLAVPPFALMQYAMTYFTDSAPDRQVLFCAYVSTLCTTVIMASLLCLILFYVFSHWFHLALTESLLLTLFFGLGTLAFPYSTAFYSHLPAACCAFSSFVIAVNLRRDSLRHKHTAALSAGLLAGLGVLIEPSALYLLAAVFLYLLWDRKARRYCLFFIAGCIPPGIAQGIYNAVCFGHPLASSYDYANDAVMVRINGSLFGVPNLKTLWQMLVSPYRGLLVTSPVLLMMFPGVVLFFCQKQWIREALVCAATSIIFFLLIASFHAWYGGSTPGPRYLIPAFPWFFMLAVWAFKKLPRLFKIIGFISILINLSITTVGVEIPADIKNPLGIVLKNIAAGRVSINPVPFSHFANYPDIYKLANIENWHMIQNHNSFNLGEILFPHHLASIMPLLVFWIIWGIWWRRTVSRLEAGQPR